MLYLLVISKYWGKQIFTHGFPRSGSKAKDGEKRKKEKKKRERKLVITMASYIHIANATSCGTRKAAWAKSTFFCELPFSKRFSFFNPPLYSDYL